MPRENCSKACAASAVAAGKTKRTKNMLTINRSVTAMRIMMVSRRAKMDTRTRGLRSGIDPSDEDISRAANCTNKCRVLGVVAQLLAQAADEHVNGAVEGFPVDSARSIENALAAQHPSGIAHQKREEFEFGRGDGEIAACQAGTAR